MSATPTVRLYRMSKIRSTHFATNDSPPIDKRKPPAGRGFLSNQNVRRLFAPACRRFILFGRFVFELDPVDVDMDLRNLDAGHRLDRVFDGAADLVAHVGNAKAVPDRDGQFHDRAVAPDRHPHPAPRILPPDPAGDAVGDSASRGGDAFHFRGGLSGDDFQHLRGNLDGTEIRPRVIHRNRIHVGHLVRNNYTIGTTATQTGPGRLRPAARTDRVPPG